MNREKTFTLAEDAKKNTWFTRIGAFTLAEVLITLGIIGVVAAMTIPTLIKNYQKTVWVNQLKKSVSTIENGFKLMLADEGVDALRDTKLGHLYPYTISPDDDLYEHNAILKKYFKIGYDLEGSASKVKPFVFDDNGKEYQKNLDSKGYGRCGDDTLLKINLVDGSTIGLEFSEGFSNKNFHGEVGIDVNGDKKGPNQCGRDIFVFMLLQNGNLVPMFGKYYANGDDEQYYKTSSESWVTCNPSNGVGMGCAARIIENGWKMDY